MARLSSGPLTPDDATRPLLGLTSVQTDLALAGLLGASSLLKARWACLSAKCPASSMPLLRACSACREPREGAPGLLGML